MIISRMNPEIRADWTAALRSGKYKQGKGQLITPILGEMHFCCLAVLCDLHSEATGKEKWSEFGRYYDQKYTMPKEVAEWADLDYNVNDEVVYVYDYHDESIKYPTLSGLNDNVCTFNEIADIIDERL